MPRRDFSKVAFAATGDVNTIPGTVQPDGSISLPSGWGFDYERDNGAGGGTPDPLAKNIDREDMNGILNEITASIGEIQQNGVAIWVSTAAPYPINAEVRHLDKIWRSAIANNNSTPGANADWGDTGILLPGTLIKTTLVTATGTFNFDSRTKKYRLRGVGGGGAGGGSGATSAGAATSGAGGTSGSFAEGFFAVTVPSVAVTIGAGGIPANGAVAGGNGGNSTFGAVMVCPGGPGGQGGAAATIAARISAANSAQAAAPTGGNIRSIPGEAGENGVVLNSSMGGAGGSNPMGSGGNAPVATGGRDAGGMGGGGSGSNSPSNTPASQAGGAGGIGGFIVEEFS